MRLIGKAPPEPEALEDARSQGFDAVELYLECRHLDRYEAAVAAIDESAVDIASVHTPHVSREKRDYLEKAAFLASRYDALLVFHSEQILVHRAVSIGEGLEGEMAYEHQPGTSRRAIENMILGRGVQLVLDTAHLFIASDRFRQDLSELLERARHVHLNDATPLRDGLAFGEGDMDLESTVETIAASGFTGDVVLEVMPEHQEAAREFVEEVLGD